ncbi:MAG: hypothetical protein A2X23_10795 [Chloroflexi bacterium GWC2_73_18]|nr:MAG: hypothetical protein A2X23_10795 [Chloroflexi bacterium GWC2_73_18]
MELALLLTEAEQAPANRRILWRDRIASHGARAIDGVRPWLSNPMLAGFAIRVIERAGSLGEADLATRVLRAERRRVPSHVAGDVAWALQRLRLVMRPPVLSRPTTSVPPARRARPRDSRVPRRRMS